jgi:hypothetical protein
MALTQLNQLQIAFKKLAGKSHTSPKLGVSNENLPSFIQLGNNTLFANPIPSTGLPSNLYQTSSNGVVEKIRFELVAFSDGGYTPSNGTVLSNTSINAEGETATNGNHTYVLRISGSYNSRSNNPKKGSPPFTDGYYLTGSNGTLQIVPPTFGSGYAITLYTAAGVEIPPLSTIDWILDYSTGVLYAQDAPGDVTPGLIDAFIYIGKYQNDPTLEYIGLFSGSLQGTASYSSQALSSSYALTASFALNAGTTINTGSFVTTSSFNNFTSSYNTGSFTGSFTGSVLGTASFANQALSSSYALTASYLDNYVPPFPFTGSAQITGSLIVTGSVSATSFIGNGSQLTGIQRTRQFDYSGSYSYQGSAPSGSSVSASVWDIYRIEIFISGTVDTKFASNAIWADRYTTIYS